VQRAQSRYFLNTPRIYTVLLAFAQMLNWNGGHAKTTLRKRLQTRPTVAKFLKWDC